MKPVDVYYIKTPHVSNVTSSYPRCSFLKGTMHGIGVRNDSGLGRWFWVGILCMGPMHWIHGWGIAYGIYPWGNARVMGKFDGETFLGGLLIFFLGGRGGKRKRQSFATVCLQAITNGGPDPRCPGQTGALFSLRQPTT